MRQVVCIVSVARCDKVHRINSTQLSVGFPEEKLAGAILVSRFRSSADLLTHAVTVLPDDEEWKEFEQKEVDYSGLRVQALQLNEERDEDDYEKEEVGEDGEIILVSGDKMSGPWNKSGAAPVAAPPVVEVEAPEPKPTGVYRPPGARMGPAKKGLTQGPPEIYNDTQFPSLSSTAKHVETRRDREMEKTFEVVKHRTRTREEGGAASAQQLQLDNQYSILGDK
ncbi:protein CDV3 homolog isoform X3 [Conger conger]|uniref:protein CDV3 homolog isoform X3 n=1 Tax=Conger conger TaxID=82655 RepID=UPI002A599DEC|nr:protein CDV3 homolog isoform X3 [Conger conger]